MADVNLHVGGKGEAVGKGELNAGHGGLSWQVQTLIVACQPSITGAAKPHATTHTPVFSCSVFE
jgi:hypothetical protein